MVLTKPGTGAGTGADIGSIAEAGSLRDGSARAARDEEDSGCAAVGADGVRELADVASGVMAALLAGSGEVVPGSGAVTCAEQARSTNAARTAVAARRDFP